MVEISREKNYFDIKALSNSLLGLMNTPRLFKLKMDNPDMEDDDKAHYRIGSALDCLQTTPDEWESKFAIVDVTRPAGLMGKFIDELPDEISFDFSETKDYETAYVKAGYKANINSIIKKFWDNSEFIKYYLLTRDKTKTILSKEEADKVFKAKELLEANVFTRYYFTSSEESDGMLDRYYQVPIYFWYMGHECKALLDCVLVNHETREITLVDLKTTGKSVFDFEQAFTMYGYYRQAAMYYTAVMSEESPFKSLIDAGYTITDFKFIVVEVKTSSFNPAIIYSVDKASIQLGLIGFTDKNGKRFKGINELINAYDYHMSTNQWSLPVDVFKNNGEIQLSIKDYAEK